jgi:hypothetical protein
MELKRYLRWSLSLTLSLAALSQHKMSTRICVTSQTNNTTNTQTLAGPTSLMHVATTGAGLAVDVAQSQSEPSSAATYQAISHS